MTTEIIFKDEETANKVADMIRSVDIFRGTKVDAIFRTYTRPIDKHYTIRVIGTKAAILAVRAISWITYKTAGWEVAQ